VLLTEVRCSGENNLTISLTNQVQYSRSEAPIESVYVAVWSCHGVCHGAFAPRILVIASGWSFGEKAFNFFKFVLMGMIFFRGKLGGWDCNYGLLLLYMYST
jgi:hypothetical protein